MLNLKQKTVYIKYLRLEKRKINNLIHVKWIKNEDGRVLTSDEDILSR